MVAGSLEDATIFHPAIPRLFGWEPLWKNRLVLSVELERQREEAEVKKEELRSKMRVVLMQEA